MGKSGKKLLIGGLMASFFILSIILLGIFISADGTLNSRIYNATSNVITIKNTSGSVVASMKLDTPQNNLVIRGKNRLVAEFTINNSDIYAGGVLENIDFYNLKDNGKSIGRTFTYKYKVITGTRDMADYGEVCKDVTNINGTQKVCGQEQIGTHKENVYDWKPFLASDLSSFPKGTTTIGIFTDVYPNDAVEWQPTLYGTKITEWATWKDSYNVSLLWIWHLDEPTGVKFPAFGNNDLNLSSGTYPVSVAGIHGNATRFDGLTQYLITKSSIATNEMFAKGVSVCFWGKSKDYMPSNDAIPFRIGGILFDPWPTGKIGFETDGDGADRARLTSTVNLNDWFFMCGIGNVTNNLIYFNGTMEGVAGDAGIDYVTGEHITVGAYNGEGDYTWNGTMDELMVWNRTLLATEVSELYDGGAGTFYSSSDITPPTISILFPQNNTNTSKTTLNINYSASDDTAIDSCWYSNDTMKKNTSLASCSTNLTTMTWTEGQHNVTIWANDTAGNVGSSTAVFFTIDTKQPNVIIRFPANNLVTTKTTLNINYSTSDMGIGVQNCWYSNDTFKTNVSITNCANITTATWTEGTHNVRVYANDSAGNYNFSLITFSIDNINPDIWIVSPANNTNTSDVNLDVLFIANDLHLESCWYSTNFGVYNNSPSSCGQNLTWITWYPPLTYLTIYTNDSAGNQNSSFVYFNATGIAMAGGGGGVLLPLASTIANATTQNPITLDSALQSIKDNWIVLIAIIFGLFLWAVPRGNKDGKK